MIKPDVMDGRPEEPGYYWCKYYDGWKLFKVEETHLEPFLRATSQDVFGTIRKEEFTQYTWSERITEPTTNVDNLNDG